MSSTKKKQSIQKQVARIEELERSLLRQGADLNPLVDLVQLLSKAKEPKIVHASIYALHRCFAGLIRQGRLHGKIESTNESAVAVKEWLKQRFSEYTDSLVKILYHDEPSLRLSAYSVLIDLVRLESDTLANIQQKYSNTSQPSFSRPNFEKLVKALLQPDPNGQLIKSDIKAEFVTRHLSLYDDIRYQFLRIATPICTSFSDQESSTSPPDHFISNMLSLLESISKIPNNESDIKLFCGVATVLKPKSEDGKHKNKKAKTINKGSTGIFDDSESDGSGSDSDSDSPTTTKNASGKRKIKTEKKMKDVRAPSAHKRAYESAWLALLPYLTETNEIKRVLNNLHSTIIPGMHNPQLLMDWLVVCCDKGGTISLLALNGLFVLIQKHSLDYPLFFTHVYALLDRHVLHVKYRARFLRLLSTFLTATNLPAALVASFIKRLGRLCLNAPVPAIVAVLPFIYNLFKLHPTCVTLIHRNPDAEGFESEEEDEDANFIPKQLQASGPAQDPFLPFEKDPLKTNAIESSLWEVASLRRHASAPVATLAKIFQEQMSKPKYDLEDFLDHTYLTLFSTEANRKMKNAPALATEYPTDEPLV